MSWFKKNENCIPIILVFVLIIVVIVSNIDFITTDIISNVSRLTTVPTWTTVFIFLILHALKGAILVVSAIMLYIAAGMIFPTWAAILVTYAGLTISLSIGYYIGCKLGNDKVNKIVAKHKRVANFLHGDKENLVSFCFVARLFPMSYGLVSMFFGALKVPYFKYLFLSLLGLSPRVIPIVLAGGAITNPLSVEFLVPFVISLCITVIIFVVYKSKVVTLRAN